MTTAKKWVIPMLVGFVIGFMADTILVAHLVNLI